MTLPSNCFDSSCESHAGRESISRSRYNPFDLAAVLATLRSVAGALATLRRSDQSELDKLLLELAATGKLPAVNALLEAGAAPDAKGKYGRTALHIAANH